MPALESKKKPEVKYQKFAEGLRAQIRSGALKPGDRLPSLAEMNERHNLSRTTVERVHRMLESDGLVVREQGRGTFVARPVKRTNGLIGFSGYAFETMPRQPYWARILEGLHQAAARQGQGVVLLDHQTFAGWNRVDGIVFSDPEWAIRERVAALPPDMARVQILFESPVHASVVPNDYQGGLLATEHLLALGHTRIATLMDKFAFPTNRRFAGYRDALAAAGLAKDERWSRNYHEPNNGEPDFVARGRSVMRRWLDEDWRELGCTAILVQNDMVAAGVMEVLQEADIAVPQQISVVGFDNLDLCDYVSPRLTSVAVPLCEIAATAMDLLLRDIEAGPGERMAATTVLPVRLQHRESTGPVIGS
jgi:DNA-binding LacI/PurR family transcriptional regulator